MPVSTLALLVALALTQARGGRDFRPEPPPHPTEPLLGYKGDRVGVRYSPGALDRAVHVVRRLDLVVTELEKPLGSAQPLSAIVIYRGEWESRGLARTYGLPQPLSIGSIAVPAVGDAGTVAKWKTWLGTDLPDPGGVPMVGTADDAASLVLSDIVLQVEACELLLDRSPSARAEPWIRGVLSHLAAVRLWTRYEPSRRSEIDLVWSRIRGQIPLLLTLEPRRLEAGEPPLAMERWLLAESHLYAGASAAYDAGGEKAWKKLVKLLHRAQPPPSPEEMFKLYPSLSEWLQGLPPEAGIR